MELIFLPQNEYNDWMRKALQEALRTTLDVPVGCLIVKDGRIIAQTHNEREETGDPTAHAEILAIREAARQLGGWRLTGTILICTLEPCAMCAEAIIQARVATLVFGAYDARMGACGSAFNLFVDGRTYPLPEIIGGIEEEECEKMLKSFFRTEVRQKKD